MVSTHPPVKPGLEVFLADPTRWGGRFGLATNPAAISSAGVASWRAFLDAGLGLAALFGGEHGFRGAAQDAVELGDETFRGIRTYSLYGARLKPEPEMLAGLDAVVFDMQDVGCRYYTFLYTLAYLMEACSEHRVPLIVLDRPNPIGGDRVEGGPIAPEQSSFVGGYGLAHRYGMTVGEFAGYLKGEFYPGADLEVVPLEGWRRDYQWEDTGLPWHLPSPNLPSPACAAVYPGTCLIEGTWLSEGRGTTRPFEVIGAPWIDGERLREALAALDLPGVVFSSLFFTPTGSKYQGQTCEGILVSPTDRGRFRALETGLALVKTVHDLWPQEFSWRESWEDPKLSFFDRLAGGPTLRTLVDAGASLAELLAAAEDGQGSFLARRAPYLRY